MAIEGCVATILVSTHIVVIVTTTARPADHGFAPNACASHVDTNETYIVIQITVVSYDNSYIHAPLHINTLYWSLQISTITYNFTSATLFESIAQEPP